MGAGLKRAIAAAKATRKTKAPNAPPRPPPTRPKRPDELSKRQQSFYKSILAIIDADIALDLTSEELAGLADSIGEHWTDHEAGGPADTLAVEIIRVISDTR